MPDSFASTASSSPTASPSSLFTAVIAGFRARRFADELAVLGAVGHPSVPCHQERRRIPIAARARHEHVTRTQPITQREQGAQFPEPSVGDRVGLVRRQVAPPTRRNERGRCVDGDLVDAVAVEASQEVHRVEDFASGVARLEDHVGEHIGRELADVAERFGEHREQTVITRQRLRTGVPRRTQPVHPDLCA